MPRGQAPASALIMTTFQQSLLQELEAKHQTGQQHAKRIRIVLLAYEGKSNSHIKRALGTSLNTVKLWRERWKKAFFSLKKFEGFVDANQATLKEYRQKILEVLSDQPRSGTPKKITLSQEQQIIALACEKPSDYGLEVTNWTHELLAQVVVAQGIISSISSRQVGRILKK